MSTQPPSTGLVDSLLAAPTTRTNHIYLAIMIVCSFLSPQQAAEHFSLMQVPFPDDFHFRNKILIRRHRRT